MLHVATVATVAVAVMIAQVLLAQSRRTPTVPGTRSDEPFNVGALPRGRRSRADVLNPIAFAVSGHASEAWLRSRTRSCGACAHKNDSRSRCPVRRRNQRR
jgi:hypothetical protein